MPRRRRADEFTETDSFDDETAPDEIPEWARESFGGFEWMVRDCEKRWIEIRRALQESSDDRRSDAPSWAEGEALDDYARRILWGIDLLRRILKKHPDQESAIVLALTTGKAIEHAVWRFNRGDLTIAGLRRRERQRAAGRQSGAIRRDRASHASIAARAREIRRTQPHSRVCSTRWLAERIAREQRRRGSTVRNVLLKLGLK